MMLLGAMEMTGFGTSNCLGGSTSGESVAGASSAKAQSITAEMSRLGFSLGREGCFEGKRASPMDITYYRILYQATDTQF